MPNAADVSRVVGDLVESDEDVLLETLGMRARAMSAEFAVAGSLSPAVVYDSKLMGPMDDLRALGRDIFDRWNREAWALLCGDAATDEKDRAELRAALKIGKVSFATALTGLLVTYLGLAPTVAVIVASIIAKRFAKSAYETTCAFWKSKLPPEPAAVSAKPAAKPAAKAALKKNTPRRR